jgi:hypothetical protein
MIMGSGKVDPSILKNIKKLEKTLDSTLSDPNCAHDDYACHDRAKKKKVTDLIRTTRNTVKSLKSMSNINVDIEELGELEAILVKALKNNDTYEASQDLHRVIERLERFYQ